MNLRNKISISLIALSLSFTAIHANKSFKNTDPEKDKILVYVLKNILTRGHFVVKDMNDDFSEQVYTSFIEGLDPSKRYFTQKDLKEFSKFKYEIDNQLLEDDVSFYNTVYANFTEKIKNAKSYYAELLSQPFHFDKNETIDIDYDKVPFAKNENQLIDYWRKQLKLNVLSRVQNKIEKQDDKIKKDPKTKKKSFRFFRKRSQSRSFKKHG